MSENEAILRGFADYSLSSQIVFRWALEALSRPAKEVIADARAFFEDPPPLPPLMAALALTLTDHHTPVWFSPKYAPFSRWLAFHQGTPIVSDPGKAMFLLVETFDEIPPVSFLMLGSERYPDSSATIILECQNAKEGKTPFRASGPGLKEPAYFDKHNLKRSFISFWEEAQASYPRGLDVFLVHAAALVGLPRTVKLSLA